MVYPELLLIPNEFDDGNPGSTSYKMWANYLKSQMMLGLGLNIQAGYLFKNLFSILVLIILLTSSKLGGSLIQESFSIS